MTACDDRLVPLLPLRDGGVPDMAPRSCRGDPTFDDGGGPKFASTAGPEFDSKVRKDRPLCIGDVTSITEACAAMLRAGGRRPHVISNKASNTCMESHRARPSNPAPKTFRVDSEMATEQLETFGRCYLETFQR
jgi:hypothetical protein